MRPCHADGLVGPFRFRKERIRCSRIGTSPEGTSVTREEQCSFPVGADRPARRRPAALDRQITPGPHCRAGSPATVLSGKQIYIRVPYVPHDYFIIPCVPSVTPSRAAVLASRACVVCAPLKIISIPFFPGKPLLSRHFISHRLVPPIQLSVLGRTYGTYLHYERSYAIYFLFGVSGVEAPV